MLSQEEVEACREAFTAFDTNSSGEIDAWELRDILKGLGRHPSDEELFEIISLVDTNMSGTIDFTEFLKVIDYQKSMANQDDNLQEIVHAFTACGGNPDKSGFVKCERVIHIVQEVFDLKFDIKSLMETLDDEEEGQIDFEKFRSIFN
uniref:Calmodulin n=1 Tax=Rhizochromulina marina TaxID=1034831 RepID=A0A7S2SNW2_9STRA|mmetsp:Transcript_32811/g.94871  ORF Transcript_32811/g.94871 Transcript_32811/m.94871 type:complete len:148 (+) Transcript_32811:144-587(+)